MITNRILGAVILLAALSALPTAAQNNDPAGKTVAVVIGISKYPRLGGGQQLQFADRDAVLVGDALKKAGVPAGNIRLLTGQEATVSAIKSAIGGWLVHNAGPGDTAIVFYSGHGFYEAEFDEGYLLGSDSDAREPFATAIALSEISQALSKRVRAGRVLLLTDAIRKDFFDPETDAGAATKFINSLARLAAARPGISVIAANGPNEFSREGARWGGQGVFANHLSQILTPGTYGNPDRNNDGILTADELYATLAARVGEDTSNRQHVWHSDSALQQIAVVNMRAPVSASSHPGMPAPANPSSAQPAETNRAAASQAGPPAETRGEARQPHAVSPARSPSAEPPANRRSEPPGEIAATPRQTAPPPEKEPNASSVSVEQPAANSRPASLPVTEPSGDSKPASAPTPPGSPPAGIGAAASRESHTGVEPPAGNHPIEPEPKTARLPARIPPPAVTAGEMDSGGHGTNPAATPLPGGPASPAPPRPGPPRVTDPGAAVGPGPEKAPITASAPSEGIGSVASPPSPLNLQIETAIAAGNLLEPKNGSAWDLYQKLAADPSAGADAERLGRRLAGALSDAGRSIVAGEVYSDTISDRLDDFRRAGQMLARARSLKADTAVIVPLEKLSAAEALIALQFFDEAERALSPLQTTRMAAVENAMGLVHQGRLDNYRAERAYKRAAELDANWATPHYNLGLLFRAQQSNGALAEFERATALDAGSVTIHTALGDEYFTRKEWPRAAEQYRLAVKLRPNDDGLHTKLGHALFSQGLQDEANREYQKALDLRGRRQ